MEKGGGARTWTREKSLPIFKPPIFGRDMIALRMSFVLVDVEVGNVLQEKNKKPLTTFSWRMEGGTRAWTDV
jgi:hypothetical protein